MLETSVLLSDYCWGQLHQMKPIAQVLFLQREKSHWLIVFVSDLHVGQNNSSLKKVKASANQDFV